MGRLAASGDTPDFLMKFTDTLCVDVAHQIWSPGGGSRGATPLSGTSINRSIPTNHNPGWLHSAHRRRMAQRRAAEVEIHPRKEPGTLIELLHRTQELCKRAPVAHNPARTRAPVVHDPVHSTWARVLHKARQHFRA